MILCSELEIGQATTLWMVVSLTLRLLGFKNRAFSHWNWATELIHHSPYLTPNSNSRFTQHQRANTTPNKSYIKVIQIALFSSYIWPQISKNPQSQGLRILFIARKWSLLDVDIIVQHNSKSTRFLQQEGWRKTSQKGELALGKWCSNIR